MHFEHKHVSIKFGNLFQNSENTREDDKEGLST